MTTHDIQEGDRFEEIQPTGEAGTLWQAISVHEADSTHPRRVHLFNVDNPAEIRTVSHSKLLDGWHYRFTDTVETAHHAAE